jgi:acyl-coenzyme A thioesterase PaaI-like protein
MDISAFDRRPDPDDARVRLADATRHVITELASSTASSDEFERARDLVEQAVAVLAERGHGRSYDAAEASLADQAASGAFLDNSPFIGRVNPLAAPIEVSYDTGDAGRPRVVGRATFGAAYEGPPGCVHGGFIAGGFDEVLGVAQSMSGQPGMTGRLEVSYRSPTPLHREVRYDGWIDRVEGRKIFAMATLHHGDVLCAEATGLFISMKPEVFQRLMSTRTQPAD